MSEIVVTPPSMGTKIVNFRIWNPAARKKGRPKNHPVGVGLNLIRENLKLDNVIEWGKILIHLLCRIYSFTKLNSGKL